MISLIMRHVQNEAVYLLFPFPIFFTTLDVCCMSIAITCLRTREIFVS